jgi:hypothetical protein
VRSTRDSTCSLTRRDEPTEGHSRDDHNEQTLRMISHVPLGQFYAYSKETCREHDTHDLSCKNIRYACPRTGIENSQDVRSQQNTKGCSERDFIHVQLFVAIYDLEET